MRSTITITTLATLPSLASAACTTRRNTNTNYECLTQEDAQQVADNFQNFSSEYSDAIANASTAENLTDYSDSTATLINAGCSSPMLLGTPLFSSRAEIEAGQASQPLSRFEILKMWYSCTDVFVYWTMPQEPVAVRGVVVLEAARAEEGAPFPWVIGRIFNEFNSGAWMVNLGVFSPRCGGGNSTVDKG